MSIFSNILPIISKGFKEVYNVDLPVDSFQIENTRKGFEGDVTIVVFQLLKISKSSPENTAKSLGLWLKSNSDIVADYNVVKGFLNLILNSEFWCKEFNSWLSDSKYGKVKSSTGKTFMVEYSSPNTNKPLHLGHLRNNFLGYSVSEILKANGHSVIKTQIINDRGIHICKSMLAWQKFGNSETPLSSGVKGDHLIGKYYVLFDKVYKEEVRKLIEEGKPRDVAEKSAPILIEAQQMLMKWEANDPVIYELWEKMNQWVYDGFAITYDRMGVDFDKLYYESDTFLLGKDVVSHGLKDGIFYSKKDGSIWCDLSADKMDDKLLLRSDGTSVYMTQDIGTAIERFKEFPDISSMIYTVGNEQNHHFKVLFSILKKIGYSWSDECYHLSYGMVELPEGKMNCMFLLIHKCN